MKKEVRLNGFLRISIISCAAAFLLVGGFTGLKAAFSGPADSGTLIFENAVGRDSAGRKVELEEENFWGGGERHVRVKNLSAFPAYVRVTPYFTARNGEGEVCDVIARDDEYLDLDLTDWIKIGGSYYYRTPLDARRYTSFLVNACKKTDPDGNTIGVRFELSGIDARDFESVRSKWKVTVSDDGTITENGGE